MTRRLVIGTTRGEKMTITDPDTKRGLYGKYRVERVDGKDKGPYFVLAPNTDPHAVNAIEEYASSCEDTHPQLAADLLAWRDQAQDLHPEHFRVPEPRPAPTAEELRNDAARALGPVLADRLDAVAKLCDNPFDVLQVERVEGEIDEVAVVTVAAIRAILDPT